MGYLVGLEAVWKEYESITPSQESIEEGNPVLNIDCWKESQVLTFNQESGDGIALDKVIDLLHPPRTGKPFMSDYSTPWSNQEDIKQGDSSQELDPLVTSFKLETMCSPTLQACQTEETEIKEISMARESPSYQTAETTDTHRDESSSAAKVSSSTQAESSPKLTKTTVATFAQDQLIPVTEIKEPSPSLDIRMTYRKCSLCCYATRCSTAFTKHREFHTSQRHNEIRTRRRKEIKDIRISAPRERKMKDSLMCVCGFISPYGDKAARHLLRCTEKSCYYMTAAAETVKDVAVCGKQESEEDKPRTLPSGEVRQNEGKEEVEGESSMTLTTKWSLREIKSISQKEAELLPYFLQKRSGKQRQSTKLFDDITELNAENIKSQLMDTSDIVSTVDFAPPTKRLMQLKCRGGVKRLFTRPGRKNTITAATKQHCLWACPGRTNAVQKHVKNQATRQPDKERKRSFVLFFSVKLNASPIYEGVFKVSVCDVNAVFTMSSIKT
uniref:Double-strand-break repair protein rad21-like protein n=1 Tax=Magallana gigas TaxID=29159 RepID=K1PWA1_MAGGI